MKIFVEMTKMTINQVVAINVVAMLSAANECFCLNVVSEVGKLGTCEDLKEW